MRNAFTNEHGQPFYEPGQIQQILESAITAGNYTQKPEYAQELNQYRAVQAQVHAGGVTGEAKRKPFELQELPELIKNLTPEKIIRKTAPGAAAGTTPHRRGPKTLASRLARLPADAFLDVTNMTPEGGNVKTFRFKQGVRTQRLGVEGAPRIVSANYENYVRGLQAAQVPNWQEYAQRYQQQRQAQDAQAAQPATPPGFGAPAVPQAQTMGVLHAFQPGLTGFQGFQGFAPQVATQ